MSNPAAPHTLPDDPQNRPTPTDQTGVVSDPDAPHAFGPDVANVLDDVPRFDPNAPVPPQTLPAEAISEDQIAPDE